jgi:D-alanyl-D-alanine carboxypeptidase
MGSWSRRLAGIVVAVVLALMPALSSAAPGREARVDAAVRATMNKWQIPGVILGVWQRGQAPLVKAYGTRNVNLHAHVPGKPMKTSFYMRLGSETKTFTGTAVLQLVEEGKVGLEDPISKYVKGVPDGDAITVRELGEMRSGLADYTSDKTWAGEFLGDPEREWKPRELLAAAFALPPSFAPGARFEYTNTNFILLGLLVEKVSGERIGRYLKRHILRPLDLEHTVFPDGSEFPLPHPQGYTGQTATGLIGDSTGYNPSWAWAAGAMISNLHDLRIWAKAVATGTLLSTAVQHQRERFIPATGLSPVRYGFGLYEVNGWIGHDGEVPGYESLVVYLPAKETTLVILTNTDAIGEPSKVLGEAVTKVITPGHVYAFGATPVPPT